MILMVFSFAYCRYGDKLRNLDYKPYRGMCDMEENNAEQEYDPSADARYFRFLVSLETDCCCVCVCVCWVVCLCVCLFVCLFVCVFVGLFVCVLVC